MRLRGSYKLKISESAFYLRGAQAAACPFWQPAEKLFDDQ